ncbi:MAG TPA: hypothetical protein VMW47_04495 [Verrucomicrobiae bacterium]|nr:hypothetical protein [Verrucomicrobiae bacterium]
MQARSGRAGVRAVAMAAVLVAIPLAACGPAAGPSRVGARSPRHVVAAADRQVLALTYRYSAAVTVSLDPAGLLGLSPAARAQLARIGDHLSIDITGVKAGAQTAEATISVPALGVPAVQVEWVQGVGYLSLPGGPWYRATVPSRSRGGVQAVLALVQRLATEAPSLVPLRDLGPATTDGVATQHYAGAATAASLSRFWQQALAGLGLLPGAEALRPDLALLPGAVASPALGVDLWVARATGRLDRVEATAGGTLNLSTIGQVLRSLAPAPSASARPTAAASTPSPALPSPAIPSGTLGIAVTLAMHWFDYGRVPSITAPTRSRPLSQLTGSSAHPLTVPAGF